MVGKLCEVHCNSGSGGRQSHAGDGAMIQTFCTCGIFGWTKTPDSTLKCTADITPGNTQPSPELWLTLHVMDSKTDRLPRHCLSWAKIWDKAVNRGCKVKQHHGCWAYSRSSKTTNVSWHPLWKQEREKCLKKGQAGVGLKRISLGLAQPMLQPQSSCRATCPCGLSS